MVYMNYHAKFGGPSLKIDLVSESVSDNLKYRAAFAAKNMKENFPSKPPNYPDTTAELNVVIYYVQNLGSSKTVELCRNSNYEGAALLIF